MFKKKPVAAEAVEAAAKNLERKRAEVETAEKELAELKVQLEAQADVYSKSGFWQSPADQARLEETRRLQEELAAAKPKLEKTPFTPNPYLCFIERAQLAYAMRWMHTNVETKSFVDPRHQVIFDRYNDDFVNRRLAHAKPETLIESLRQCGRLELAGGEEFILNIYEGLHDE